MKKSINEEDAAILGYIVNEITGRSGSEVSDQTIFIFEDGSVSNTIPATPDHFRGDKSFRHLRSLPEKKYFSGRMIVNRQGGEIKNYNFQ